MEPTRARAVLLAQHDGLRRLLGAAQVIAERVLAGEGLISELQQHLDELRAAFAEHNVSEETLLEPIRGSTSRGGRRASPACSRSMLPSTPRFARP
jgi:hypothetical protein